MPVSIIVERCEVCESELTVYARAYGFGGVFSLSRTCLTCEAREAAQERETSDLRAHQTMGEGGDEPGDLVRSKEEVLHHVYELIDGRTGMAFYVGVTKNLKGRLYDHGMPNSTSAALIRIQEIRQSGHKYKMVIIASFENRARAEAYEALLINETPDLVNLSVPLPAKFECPVCAARRAARAAAQRRWRTAKRGKI